MSGLSAAPRIPAGLIRTSSDSTRNSSSWGPFGRPVASLALLQRPLGPPGPPRAKNLPPRGPLGPPGGPPRSPPGPFRFAALASVRLGRLNSISRGPHGALFFHQNPREICGFRAYGALGGSKEKRVRPLWETRGGPRGSRAPPMGLRVARWGPLGLARGPFGETGGLPGGALGPPRVFVGPNRDF